MRRRGETRLDHARRRDQQRRGVRWDHRMWVRRRGLVGRRDRLVGRLRDRDCLRMEVGGSALGREPGRLDKGLGSGLVMGRLGSVVVGEDSLVVEEDRVGVEEVGSPGCVAVEDYIVRVEGEGCCSSGMEGRALRLVVGAGEDIAVAGDSLEVGDRRSAVEAGPDPRSNRNLTF